jgi:hypothetical protein
LGQSAGRRERLSDPSQFGIQITPDVER